MKRTFTVRPKSIQAAEEFPIDNPFEGWTSQPKYVFNTDVNGTDEIESEIINGIKAGAHYDSVMEYLDTLLNDGIINEEERIYFEGFADDQVAAEIDRIKSRS